MILCSVLRFTSYFLLMYNNLTDPLQVDQSTFLRMQIITNLSAGLTPLACMTSDCTSNSFIVSSMIVGLTLFIYMYYLLTSKLFLILFDLIFNLFYLTYINMKHGGRHEQTQEQNQSIFGQRGIYLG